MRVAVLGAGNGGVASAFDFAQHGHEVSLYAPAQYGDNIVAIRNAGGIRASGDLEGFVPVRYSGHDAGEAMEDAQLVVLVGPAYATDSQAADAGAAPARRHGRAHLPRLVRGRDRLQARRRASRSRTRA